MQAYIAPIIVYQLNNILLSGLLMGLIKARKQKRARMKSDAFKFKNNRHQLSNRYASSGVIRHLGVKISQSVMSENGNDLVSPVLMSET